MNEHEKITTDEFVKFLWKYHKNPMQNETLGAAFLDTYFPDIDDPLLRGAEYRDAQEIIYDDYVYFGTGDKLVGNHGND